MFLSYAGASVAHALFTSPPESGGSGADHNPETSSSKFRERDRELRTSSELAELTLISGLLFQISDTRYI